MSNKVHVLKIDVEIEHLMLDEAMRKRNLVVDASNRKKFLRYLKNIPLHLSEDFFRQVTTDQDFFRHYGLQLIGEEASSVTATVSAKEQVAEFVFLTEEEQQQLRQEHGEQKLLWLIQKLDSYKRQSGRTYQSDAQAIRSWVVKAYEEAQRKGMTLNATAGRGSSKEAEDLERRLIEKRETVNRIQQKEKRT